MTINNPMYTTVLRKIAEFLFGYAYYVNIIGTIGTREACISSFIFQKKEQAMRHKESLSHNSSYYFIETRRFFSRHAYDYRDNGAIGKCFILK